MQKRMWALALIVAVSAPLFAATNEFVKVEMQGILHSDNRGMSIEANGFNYLLNLSRNRGLTDFVTRNDGKAVLVQGWLDVQTDSGKACPTSLTVSADSIKPLAGAAQETQYQPGTTLQDQKAIQDAKRLQDMKDQKLLQDQKTLPEVKDQKTIQESKPRLKVGPVEFR